MSLPLPPSRLRRALALAGALAALAACAGAPRVPSHSVAPDSAQIRRDIAYLASDQLEGRGTGTPGNDSAAAYIARRYVALGLQPVAGVSAAGGAPAAERFLQHFSARSAAAAHMGVAEALPTQNVVALLPGSDPALRGEYVVIGAHFDHLGRSSANALDPEAKDAIRNGADDNASGTAAVMELARLLKRHPPRRSVLFVNFSGEELGLLGSQWFVEHPPVPLDSVQAMLNFDMVGRLHEDKLIVYGVATAAELRPVLDSANAAVAPSFALSAVGDGFGPSDQASFYAKGVPVLHFFTDLHADYHRATDDVEKINAGGEARVVALAERVARNLADRPGKLAVVRSAPPTMGRSSREGSKVYFGSIPDMAASDVPGMRITGVSPGSPADQAGLRAGDVIVELGGTEVKDLYSYTDALYSHQPGDRVSIVVLRGSERVTLQAVLGTRQ